MPVGCNELFTLSRAIGPRRHDRLIPLPLFSRERRRGGAREADFGPKGRIAPGKRGVRRGSALSVIVSRSPERSRTGEAAVAAQASSTF